MDNVLNMVDADLAMQLTREFVRVQTTNPPGNELRLAELLLARGSALGLDGELQPVDDDRANVILRLPGGGDGPRLMYCGHLDTVQLGDAAWAGDPFGADVDGGRLYGRGSCDMKGGLAAMITGMAALAAAGVRLPGELVLAAVVGEEVDCRGSRHLLEQGGMDGVGGLVIAEPTGLDVVPAHKGAIRAQVTAYGKPAHGAMPELGVNAITHMLEFLRRLDGLDLSHVAHPHLAAPTVSVNRIDGGVQPNIVADRCRVDIDVRTVPGQDHARIIADIERMAAAVQDATAGLRVEAVVLQDVPSVETPDDAPLVLATRTAAERSLDRSAKIRGVQFFSDGSVLQPATGVPTVLFGPGDERVAHQTDEYVETQAISDAARVFAVLPLVDGWSDALVATTRAGAQVP
jgi:succinyl-diaminopimelate desuccinylase